MSALDKLLRETAEELVAVVESVLDSEDLDYRECAALQSYPLCGAAPCQANGCLVDKRRRALAAIELAERDQ